VASITDGDASAATDCGAVWAASGRAAQASAATPERRVAIRMVYLIIGGKKGVSRQWRSCRQAGMPPNPPPK
jgi:hypothetical protein